MQSDGEDSPKQGIQRKNKPVAPLLLSDDTMGEGPHHSWELSDSGNLSSSQAVMVSVIDLNDHTAVFSSGTTGSVNENAATSTVIYTAVASDADGTSAHNTKHTRVHM